MKTVAVQDLYLSPNRVLADAVDAAEGSAPEWIQLTPNRGKFEGRDGRRFNVKTPRQIVRDFNGSGEHLQLDIDHKSEFAGFFNDDTTESFGWVTQLATRNGGEIWARVDWTEDGEALVTSKKFRGLSPVFTVTRESRDKFLDDPQKEAMEVTGIVSVALTNRPNLKIKSLNTSETDEETITVEEETVTMDKELLAALGLNEDASADDALEAIEALKAKPEPVDLSAYVPRADYDQLNGKFAAAIESLEKDREQRHAERVDAVITEALKAGKIAPTSEAYHRAVCATAEGLEQFKQFLAAAPSIVPQNPEKEEKDIEARVAKRDVELANQVGVTVEDIQKAREELRARGEIE